MTAETHAVDTVETHSSDTADAHSTDTAEAHSSDTAETHATDTADTHASDTADTHSSDTADTHSTDIAETQTTEAADTQPTVTTETPPALIAGTLFTGTAGLDPMSFNGTDSSSTATDWGTITSTSVSTPAADDTGGSTHDTVAAPVTATAPDVSTTVDASPPATVETSPATTHEAATVAVTSDGDVPAAPASAAPVPTEAAPTTAAPAAAVVPPPVAVCTTAGNCTTVLQAMLTSVANMVIAPLSTVSSWFGAIWYQASPQPAPRVQNRWTAAGARTGSGLASVLMPSGVATVLRYNTVHGGTQSIGETVQDQIDNVDQATLAASSAPMSSQMTITSSATAPRKFTRFFRHALDTIASSPSLIVLATAALPGLGGFLIITGAGMRIGYRQAKFGFVMRSSGLARYVRPGPLGVVRSGGLIAVRPRTRPQRFLEKAA